MATKVTFENDTNDTVSFFHVLPNDSTGITYRFTLHPRPSPDVRPQPAGPPNVHEEELPSGAALTNEKLRMLVGEDSRNGQWTDITITTDDLSHLKKVTIKKRLNGDFLLETEQRSDETAFQKITNFLWNFFRRSKGTIPRGRPQP